MSNDTNKIEFLKAAAEQGDARAQYRLEERINDSISVLKDKEAAVMWYRAAAEQSSPGQCSLGLMYEYGRGVEEDKVEAYIWYWIAARGGNEKGITNKERLAKELTPDEIRDAEEEAKRRAEEIDKRNRPE